MEYEQRSKKNIKVHFPNQCSKDQFLTEKNIFKTFILTVSFMILVFNWYICLLHFSSPLALRNSYLQIFKGESHFNIAHSLLLLQFLLWESSINKMT